MNEPVRKMVPKKVTAKKTPEEKVATVEKVIEWTLKEIGRAGLHVPRDLAKRYLGYTREKDGIAVVKDNRLDEDK